METKYQQNSFNLTVPLSESPRKTKSDRTWFRVGKQQYNKNIYEHMYVCVYVCCVGKRRSEKKV